jgi:hypothetical protein
LLLVLASTAILVFGLSETHDLFKFAPRLFMFGNGVSIEEKRDFPF